MELEAQKTPVKDKGKGKTEEPKAKHPLCTYRTPFSIVVLHAVDSDSLVVRG